MRGEGWVDRMLDAGLIKIDAPASFRRRRVGFVARGGIRMYGKLLDAGKSGPPASPQQFAMACEFLVHGFKVECDRVKKKK
jgi:hypothetical protein